jgi:hypothetical protein
MTRLCIVGRDELMLYGYLLVALERQLEGPDRMEVIFDRRWPAPSPGDAPLDVERRTHPEVEEVLRTQGYVILDENRNVAAPEKLPASRKAVLLWKSAAEWAGARARSAWQARPATGTVAKFAGVLGALAISAVLLWKSAAEWAGARARSAWQARPATGTVVKFAGVLGLLVISAVLVAVQFSTRAVRWVVLRGAESGMASAPTQTAMASPPTDASPSALVVGPHQAGSTPLVASPPAPEVPASPLADRPPAPSQPFMRRTPVPAPVTTPARASAPTSAEPTVVLETDPQGKGNQRSITYTARVLDASGQPLTNAEVSLLAWMTDGSDLKVPLRSTETPGTYRGSAAVGVFTPGNLRVRIAHGEKSFYIAPQRRQR